MVYEAFGAFRRLHQQLRTELMQQPSAGVMSGGENTAAHGTEKVSHEPERRESEVGEDEEARGVSVGVAPLNSRPAADDRPVVGGGDQGDGGEGIGTEVRRVSVGAVDEERPPDKQSVFGVWKDKEGQMFEEAFNKNRAEIKAKKVEMKESLLIANTKKREIDEAKERLARKIAEKDVEQEDDHIDEEEYMLIKNLKDLKAEHREAFERHSRLKMDVMQIEHLNQQCKVKLVQSFEEWYNQKYGHLEQAPKTMFKEYNKESDQDRQEHFDLMEADRFDSHHPDAVAYHKAKTNASRVARNRRTGVVAGGRGLR